jgi:hypothetical protein
MKAALARERIPSFFSCSPLLFWILALLVPICVFALSRRLSVSLGDTPDCFALSKTVFVHYSTLVTLTFQSE